MTKRSMSAVNDTSNPSFGFRYFIENPLNFTPKGYTQHRLSEAPNVRSKTIVVEWLSWISYLTESKNDAVRDAAKNVTSISIDLINRWKVEYTNNRPPEPLENITTGPAIGDCDDKPECSSSAHYDEIECSSSSISGKRVKSISSQSSSRQLSRASSYLSPTAVSNMRKDFKMAFNEFKGDLWITPSGVNVDDTLFSYIVEMENESCLHSFIIDRLDSILPLFSEGDQLSIKDSINKRDSIINQFELRDCTVEELLRYRVDPDTLSDLLRGGWEKFSSCEREGMSVQELDELHRTFQRSLSSLLDVYKQHPGNIRDRSESWYRTYIWGFLALFFTVGSSLSYEPGEVPSTASAIRKNQGRVLDGKNRLQGRKADGIILCRYTNSEICTFEYGCIDNELTGTKELLDLRKLSKSMKDMFDAIIKKCKDPVTSRKELRTFGVLISGLRLYIFSLQHHAGRFFVLKNEAALAIPSAWERLESTITIVSLLCKLLIFKDCLSSTCEKIIQWTNSSAVEEMKRFSCPKVETHQYFVATLPTPVSSPKR